MKKKAIAEKTPETTANDWLAVLIAASTKNPEVVPDGFKTQRQISEEIGKSDTQTRAHLRSAMNAGIVEMKKFRIRTGDKIYPVPHFRILK